MRVRTTQVWAERECAVVEIAADGDVQLLQIAARRSPGDLIDAGRTAAGAERGDLIDDVALQVEVELGEFHRSLYVEIVAVVPGHVTIEAVAVAIDLAAIQIEIRLVVVVAEGEPATNASLKR